MAELPRATLTLASQERQRLALDRERRASAEALGNPEAPLDVDAAALNVPFLGNRVLNMANQDRVNLRSRDELDQSGAGEGPRSGGGAQAVDQAAGREAREQRLRAGLMQARTAGQGQAPAAAGGGPAAGGSGAGVMAAALKGGGGVGGAAAALAGGGGGAQVLEGIGQKLGGGAIKALWEALAPSFAHSIWLIDLIFFLGWSSKFFRRWIPEVGHEWLQPDVVKKIPKNLLLPLKYAELTAIILITLLVAAADLMILTMIVFMITVIMAVAGA